MLEKTTSQWTVGLIAIAAKPFHAGHWNLIHHALQKCNYTAVFVSTSDRGRKGEFKILGHKMTEIWYSLLIPSINEFVDPGRVSFAFSKNPITRLHEHLESAHNSPVESKFVIFGDEVDVNKNFSDEILQKYQQKLFNRIERCPVPRSETENISGTQMRNYLKYGDRSKFKLHVPEFIDADKYWDLLRK